MSGDMVLPVVMAI